MDTPTDEHGTPVQNYVGPQASVKLPDWRPAPIVPQAKADSSFSDAEMAALRAAAGQDVDARRATKVRVVVIAVVAIVVNVIVFVLTGSVTQLTLFNVGLAFWTGTQTLLGYSSESSALSDIMLRHSIAQNNALLGFPSDEAMPSSSSYSYLKRARKSVAIGFGLVAILVIFWVIAQFVPAFRLVDDAAVITFAAGLGVAIILQYLTLRGGIVRLNEAARQRRVDELIGKWMAV